MAGEIFKYITGKNINDCDTIEDIDAAVEKATGKKVKVKNLHEDLITTREILPITKNKET